MSAPIAREEIIDLHEVVDAEGVRWRSVTEFPNYRVSSVGTIKNHTSGKLLSTHNLTGYTGVALSLGGKQKTLRMHILVAKAYLWRPDDGDYTVDHMNRNMVDNTLENLRWATKSEQARNQASKKPREADGQPPADVEWRPIPASAIEGEHGYEISSKGAWLRYGGTNTRLRTSARKPFLNPATRYCLHTIGGKGYVAHRLVVRAWIGEIPEGHMVDHKNEVRSDNDASNLRIVTRSENGKHSRVVRVAVDQRLERTGDVIATFKSMVDAARETQTKHGSIATSMRNGVRVMAKADGTLYYWSKQGTPPVHKSKTRTWRRAVTQHAVKNGQAIATYKSGNEAAKATGGWTANILLACNRDWGSVLAQNDGKRYFWRFA
ncbi:hypothetical protein JKP88DRAFT_241217 [Tribonema minus]|uniref:HNH nuclease domain-containing protein n=1 Tax=Tribonema minus TaxID=303371 RepID=A0A835YWT4_9STRA|nr:hypothetical protein JKP88DRAFT_241217 [Tribonema minus]